MTESGRQSPARCEVLTASEEETIASGESLGRSRAPATSSCSSGISGRGKLRSCEASPGGRCKPRGRVQPDLHARAGVRGHALTLYHVDLYRLDPGEIDDLGLEDLISADGIVAIEWAERWRGRPDDAIEVTTGRRGRRAATHDGRRRLEPDLPTGAVLPLFDPVVGRLFGDHHVVHVPFRRPAGLTRISLASRCNVGMSAQPV